MIYRRNGTRALTTGRLHLAVRHAIHRNRKIISVVLRASLWLRARGKRIGDRKELGYLACVYPAELADPRVPRKTRLRRINSGREGGIKSVSRSVSHASGYILPTVRAVIEVEPHRRARGSVHARGMQL